MKTFRLILSVLIALAMISLSYAGTVTVNGQNMGTLGSMSVSGNGDVTLTTSGGPPTGGLTLSLNPSSLPPGTVDVPYNQSVTMTASNGTPPYVFDCTATNITANQSTGVCTISGTPAAAGAYTVNFSVTDDGGLGDTVNTPIIFNVNPPGSGGGAELLPSSGVGMIIGQGVQIPAYGQKEYYFTIPSAAATYVAIYMTTRDWQTNQDMYVSTSSQPACGPNGSNVPNWAGIPPQPWYNTTATNNESLILMTSFPAGTTFYLTVCNTSGIQGEYGLYWQQR
jgi:hypothetical protein